MNPANCSISGDFLNHQGRRLFYLLLEPTHSRVRGSVLYLPPFAEEMHKSRQIVANTARELAADGYRVMLLDLTGCGDSGGDFADASWQVWLQDARFAIRTLAEFGSEPLSLWGLRLGALLACELAQGRTDISRLVLWQPVLNGEQQVDQFLRLKTAATVVSDAITFDRKSLWHELRAGRSLNIAGYELPAILALEMSRARLNDLLPPCPVHWLEIGATAAGNPSAASEHVIARWREQGLEIGATFVQGEPFWRMVDARENPQLQLSTMKLFAQQ
jgi:exosortase A-associated hydrolase 2